jgi:hypothetical protein
MKDQPLPINLENGRVESEYKAAAKRLGTIKVRQMGDMRQLRNAGADVAFRQCEIAAIVEFLCEKGGLTTHEFLRRVTEIMNKQAGKESGSAIFVPGRSN